MILPFATSWPEKMGRLAGHPTRFAEKIWQSLLETTVIDEETYGKWYYEDGILDLNMGNNFDYFPFLDYPPKLHTIREDKKNRWRSGMMIHPVIYFRTKKQFQFAPPFLCTGTQRISIRWKSSHRGKFKKCRILIDEKYFFGDILYESTTEELAINDGFESVRQFLSWFHQDFDGKIIHWTDKRY